jgi:hypothetical protein
MKVIEALCQSYHVSTLIKKIIYLLVQIIKNLKKHICQVFVIVKLSSKPSLTIIVATLQDEIAYKTKSIKMKLTITTLAKVEMPTTHITQCQHANQKIEKKAKKNCEFANAKISPNNKKVTTSF